MRSLAPLALPFVQKTLVAAALIIICTGCNNAKEVIEIDPRFSINVTRVPSWYPGEKEEPTPAQEEVIRLYGRPDFFRHQWDTDGELYTSSDFSGRQAELPTILEETQNSWIYYKEEIEIEFPNDAQYIEHPLQSQLKLICQYGDPDVKAPVKYDSGGRKIERWRWMGTGINIMFVDGIEMEREHFKSTGRGTYIIK